MIEVALIGCGGLGGALAHGLVKNSAFSLSICDRNDHKMAAFKALGAKTFTEVDAACEMADLILGCVKPHATPELMRTLKNQNAVFVSCAAGLELETLVPAYKGRVVRAMPNIGAQYQASATACFGDAEMNAQERALVEALFEQLGQCVWLKSEKDFYAATAISGSGPAFALVALEAMEDAGVEAGLSRQSARAFARGALNVAALSVEGGRHPAEVRAQITSPGGITIKGLATLEESGGRAAYLKTIRAAIEKTISMR